MCRAAHAPAAPEAYPGPTMATIELYSDPKVDLYVELGTAEAPALLRLNVDPGGGRHQGYAVIGPDGAVLVDPPLPSEPGVNRLLRLLSSAPRATVLTSDWHERASYLLRERWGTPVWAPAAGLRERGGELDGTPDHFYEEGTPLPGGLRALKLEGVFPGEHLLRWRAPTGEHVLFTGDAINGQLPEHHPRPDDWRAAPGLYLGVNPLYAAWLADPVRLQAGLRRALAEPCDLLCGSHARPFCDEPAVALRLLLEQDWAALILAGNRPAVYTTLLRRLDFGRRDSLPLVRRTPR